MANQEQKSKVFKGKTYSLYGSSVETDQYYTLIKKLADLFLQKCRDEKRLLQHIQIAGNKRSFLKKLIGGSVDYSLISFIKKTLKESLSVYTKDVKHHLRTLSLSQRFDSILRTREKQYHLYMLEIELINRIYRESFIQSEYKFALIGHCLRDFRHECKAEPGNVDYVCRGCTKECLINLGSMLLKKYNIHPYISVDLELDKLFKKLKVEHPSIGALGIVCVPELANGIRLCIKLGISPLGVPLDANRCARWMKQAHETSFNLRELEDFLN